MSISRAIFLVIGFTLGLVTAAILEETVIDKFYESQIASLVAERDSLRQVIWRQPEITIDSLKFDEAVIQVRRGNAWYVYPVKRQTVKLVPGLPLTDPRVVK